MLALVVIIGLAAYRASRLIQRDTILDGWRHRFYRRFPPNDYYRKHYRLPTGMWQIDATVKRKASWLGKLVACPYCSSVWFAAAITGGVVIFGSVPLPFLAWGAACSVAVLCATLDPS